jgi:hypothetical protein
MNTKERLKLRDQLFGKKKRLWMWLSTKETPLKLSVVMVYAYRAYQDEYMGTPSISKICKATGLSKTAIQTADQALLAAGLLDADHGVVKERRWYIAGKDSLDKCVRNSPFDR